MKSGMCFSCANIDARMTRECRKLARHAGVRKPKMVWCKSMGRPEVERWGGCPMYKKDGK